LRSGSPRAPEARAVVAARRGDGTAVRGEHERRGKVKLTAATRPGGSSRQVGTICAWIGVRHRVPVQVELLHLPCKVILTPVSNSQGRESDRRDARAVVEIIDRILVRRSRIRRASNPRRRWVFGVQLGPESPESPVSSTLLSPEFAAPASFGTLTSRISTSFAAASSTRASRASTPAETSLEDPLSPPASSWSLIPRMESHPASASTPSRSSIEDRITMYLSLEDGRGRRLLACSPRRPNAVP